MPGLLCPILLNRGKNGTMPSCIAIPYLVWATVHPILLPAHHSLGSVIFGMSDMKSATLAPVRVGALTVVLCVLLVSACASPGVRLSDADRASLANQPAIQVLHYETPLPAIKAGSKNPPPARLMFASTRPPIPRHSLPKASAACLARR